ncbi:DUF2513 domain-containing protein [Nitrosospira sp. Nsp13]|uniref:DUF2513 domain-containing protein n=1 Tax=Nitrosospira sp. Nsp13 TaxID=1855332 RepID=UPI000886F6BD|nr:DUF2513 domain-containing protein [Nitrosospira sp. Nsp13]SCY27705.1 Hypothetical protein SAMN05216308_106195 [Nitrosospira sp. Nsp13]
MKRDFDLIREILLHVEASPANVRPYRVQFPESDQDTIDEHVELLIESGLLEGNPRHRAGAPLYVDMEVMVARLTWDGHDFLSSIQDDTIWRKAKATILMPSASFTFGLLVEWLKIQIKAKTGIP